MHRSIIYVRKILICIQGDIPANMYINLFKFPMNNSLQTYRMLTQLNFLVNTFSPFCHLLQNNFVLQLQKKKKSLQNLGLHKLILFSIYIMQLFMLLLRISSNWLYSILSCPQFSPFSHVHMGLWFANPNSQLSHTFPTELVICFVSTGHSSNFHNNFSP